ncbi:glycosyltransferase family 4 protein [Botrimarina colliarenosi]|nr:glycosyltransferase family 4 protein [Botrimarina colliarenosi]
MSPYELHFYNRLANELPAQMLVLNAYGDSSRQWRLATPLALTLEDLSAGDRTPQSVTLGQQRREWRRGGEVIERLKQQRSDALILVGYNDLGRLRTAFWCWRHSVPVLLRADSNLADEQGKSPLKLAVKRAYIALVRRLVTAVLAVGPLGVAYWKHYGVPGDRLYVSPYEPDYALIENVSDDEIAAAAERHQINRTRRRLVFSGRFVSVKRVDLLIKAFAQIANERPDWDLLLIGDGELRQELETMTPSDLRERVQWTGFMAEQREVNLLYRLSDVLVLPSEREPWAVVLNEAAASGLALVTSDVVGAAAALLRPGVNGEKFASGDLDGLAHALRTVTDPTAIDRYRAGSGEVLAAWRSEADPVAAVRDALRDAGVSG